MTPEYDDCLMKHELWLQREGKKTNRAHKCCVSEDGKRIYPLQWIPEIRNTSSTTSQRCAAKEACEETEGELCTDVGRECRGHGEDHVDDHCYDVCSIRQQSLLICAHSISEVFPQIAGQTAGL